MPDQLNPNNGEVTSNHNLPKIPELDQDYNDEWGFIVNRGEFADGSDAGSDSLLDALEERIVVRDLQSEVTSYTPHDDALFYATDTGRIYLGDGSSWTAQSFGTSAEPVPGTSHFEAVSATGQSIVQARRSVDLSVNAGSWNNVLDQEGLDNLNEFNESSNAQFVPNNAGIYRIDCQIQFFNASDGDNIEIRFRDTDAQVNTSLGEITIEDTWSYTNDYTRVSFLVTLTAGNAHELQAQNATSNSDIGGGSTWMQLVRTTQQT